MPEINQILAHYALEEKIGKGGMGEVFRAKDQKLGREVAIKVLSEEFARDADRVARFQREAKLLASLNHPNIGSIYGLEEAEGTNFIVLELIEGDTLADRLKHGAIPVEDALKLALQIAEALEAAHEKGVIHRDLKPANIKVTPDGKVKVLDFGLAKAYAGEQEDVNLSNSPTLSAAATQQGVILGTAAYMSPEQARGKQVDKRADVWAFGCVLYEMLAGRAAFLGRDVTDILAAVIRAEPEWKSLPANLHWRLREVLERCLEKEAKDRYGSINDARVDIQRVLKDPSGIFVEASAIAKSRKKLRTMMPWIAAIILIGIIVGFAVWKLKPTEPRQISRFYHDLPEDQLFTRTANSLLAISADSTKMVYAANQQLHLKNFNELSANPIPGTNEDPIDPFFSPDSKWIGYFSVANRQLKRIAITGGAPVTLCSVENFGGAYWTADNKIMFGEGSAIMGIPAGGGTPEPIFRKESGAPLYPQLLPDEKSILYTVRTGAGLQTEVVSFESGVQKELFAGGPAKYLKTGHIVYGLENDLYAIRFDLDNLEVVGGPVSMLEGIFRLIFITPMQYALSDSGALAYIPGATNVGSSERTLVWVDREGKEEPILLPSNAYQFPKISPDGSQVAVTIARAGNTDIYIGDLDSDRLTRLTFNEATEQQAIWTLDGKRIFFASDREDNTNCVYWKAADGTGETVFFGSVPDIHIVPYSWSRDGNTLILLEINANWNMDITAMSTDDENTRKMLIADEYAEYQPKVSPDGRWIAYSSSESGQGEVYVRVFPDVESGGRWQVSTSGGDSPLWSPDGQELFYRSFDSMMMVPLDTEPSFKHGTPQVLFQGVYVGLVGIEGTPWDIHPDGKRFLMMKEEGYQANSLRKINIVLNWFEELKERVPVD